MKESTIDFIKVHLFDTLAKCQLSADLIIVQSYTLHSDFSQTGYVYRMLHNYRDDIGCTVITSHPYCPCLAQFIKIK